MSRLEVKCVLTGLFGGLPLQKRTVILKQYGIIFITHYQVLQPYGRSVNIAVIHPPDLFLPLLSLSSIKSS